MTEIKFDGQPITTVIFDLDGTLRYSIPGGDQFMLEKAVKLGLTCTEDCLVKTRQWAHRYWASSENLMLDQQTYGKGETAFWENYARRTLESLQASPNQVRELAPKTGRMALAPDEAVICETPGAGGYGPPGERSIENIAADEKSCKFTPAFIARHYPAGKA